MKGVFFQKESEWRLEAPGIEWQQGGVLSGSLEVVNKGREPVAAKVILALANLKKVKQKEAKAFEVLAEANLTDQNVAPGSAKTFNWTFELGKNIAISDKAQSLYLLCGEGALEEMGQLPVTVRPHPHLQVLYGLLETTFRFVLKGQKSSKGWVEAKLKPSTAKRFTSLDQLVLYSRFEDETLVLKYVFHLRQLSATASSLGVSKEKFEFEQRLEERTYLFPGGIVNHQPLEAAMEEAFAAVKERA